MKIAFDLRVPVGDSSELSQDERRRFENSVKKRARRELRGRGYSPARIRSVLKEAEKTSYREYREDG